MPSWGGGVAVKNEDENIFCKGLLRNTGAQSMK